MKYDPKQTYWITDSSNPSDILRLETQKQFTISKMEEVLPKQCPSNAKVQTTSSRRANLRAKVQMVRKARDYTNTTYKQPEWRFQINMVIEPATLKCQGD